MPSNHIRHSIPNLIDELQTTRKAILDNDSEAAKKALRDCRYFFYTFHPSHQLRLSILPKGYSDYIRWTDYETAEVGVRYTDSEGVWERKTFTSRADDVTITEIKKSSHGAKINMTVSIDNPSSMYKWDFRLSDAQHMKYKKIVDSGANYIAQIAHYPNYENSELKNGGFAGLTYILVIGGKKEKIELGGVKDPQNIGADTSPAIKISDADAVYLISKSERTPQMCGWNEFSAITRYPLIEELIAQLKTYATEWESIPMLAKTHGQPASPTRLGKEIMVFVYRLERQLATLKACPVTAKFGGATGNYNAHHVAYPEYDWKAFGNQFVAEKLGLEREEYTTQISNYDNLSAIFDAMKRINTVMIDMNRDFWQYISMEYFKQKIKAGEVGSSAMPHKVNPIDFENAEGNLGIANAILEHLAVKLPVSRLQRDLTDSTVLRNVGTPFGHIVIAIQSSLKGLRKLLLNETAIYRDLDNCWSVVAEAIQTILRREAYPHPYEALKALTRTNQAITETSIKEFIEGLDVNEEIKKELRVITPHSYTGI